MSGGDAFAGVVQPMAEFLGFHRTLGEKLAWMSWLECFDINQNSNKFLDLEAVIGDIKRNIEILNRKLYQSLNEGDFSALLHECLLVLESTRETTEQEIERKYRLPNIVFNKGALIILTEANIPEDIQIALSFGYKFLFPYETNNENLPEILAQLEMCIDQAVPDARILETSIDMHQILKHRDSFQDDDNIKWLKFVSKRTTAFFRNNPNIFATKSDKGGHTVVIDVSEYEAKLAELLGDTNYIELDHEPLLGLVESEKEIFSALSDNETNGVLRGLPRLEPDTLGLPKFYGLPKIHKKDTPLRPITATIGCVGYLTAKVFAKMIDQVFPRTDHHIKDSYEFAKYIQNVTIEETDILVSFDVVSMYTSIPFELVKDLILKKSDEFLNLFSIEKPFLEKILNFLLRDCMVFTALDSTYKQVNGLPMGSCVSPHLARIVMDQVMDNLLEQIPHISFMKVFVDDSIAAINKNFVDKALQTLNDFTAEMRFTCETEENASLNFLNLTLKRDKNRIVTNWYRKHYASGRLLNFHSSHKRTTVLGTGVHFVRTVLFLSDGEFFHSNKTVIRETLRDNCFPETIIVVLMNNFYTYMRPLLGGVCHDTSSQAWWLGTHFEEVYMKPAIENKPSEPKKIVRNDGDEEKHGYVIFPHSICKGRDIKRVLCRQKAPGVKLADSVRNTRVNVISSRKTITPIEKRKNLILTSKCICRKKYKVVQTGFNETGEITQNRILTNMSECLPHSHAFKRARLQRGLHYGSQTRYLLKYIKYKYRGKLDVSSGILDLPNPHLSNLIK